MSEAKPELSSDREVSSDRPTQASFAPLSFATYGLTARDLPRMVDFYMTTVGLTILDRTTTTAMLGNDGLPLLEIAQNTAARPDDIRAAGLHHAAFLMPTRRDLADWYLHGRRLGLALSRTGDHHVNEALYFDDPEGNGVECYADRPASHWRWDAAGKVYITTDPVDLDGLLRDASADAATRAWTAPRGLRMGHINLRVGDLDAADRFYCDMLGLEHTCRRERMTFMSSGRYHHHMAANIVSSDRAGRRDRDRAGLAWFAFANSGAFDADAAVARLRAAGAPVDRTATGFVTEDPWGTRIRVLDPRR